MDPSEHDYLYDAFISYRRSDGAAIEGFVTVARIFPVRASMTHGCKL